MPGGDRNIVFPAPVLKTDEKSKEALGIKRRIKMNTDEKTRYFRELTLNLRHEGFTVRPETENGLLSVELDD